MLIDVILFVAAFVGVWIGAGIIVKSLHKFARSNRYSEFATSFLLLGLLTSVPELGVGLNAVAENEPSIFVGNLLGGIVTIFLLIIPILAIAGNGIKLSHSFSRRNLILCLMTIALPTFFILDGMVTNIEGILMLVAYIALLFVMFEEGHTFRQSIVNPVNLVIPKDKFAILKIIGGVIIVFISSRVIVDHTIAISEMFNIQPFFLSLFVISLGTNIPELSLAIRTVYSGQKDIAFGNYLGSAAANVLLFGVFTLMSADAVIAVENSVLTFLVITTALFWFYYFLRSNNNISRKEGIALLAIYLLFLFTQV